MIIQHNVRKLKLTNGNTILGWLIDDKTWQKNKAIARIIGNNRREDIFVLGNPASLKSKNNQTKLSIASSSNQVFIPEDMILNISVPDTNTFQKYHDLITATTA